MSSKLDSVLGDFEASCSEYFSRAEFEDALKELAALRANQLDPKIVEAVRAYQRTFAGGSDFTILASIAHAEAFARLLSAIGFYMKEGNT